MPVPLNQSIRVGAYVVKQHLAGRARYPLVLMLEPLFRCNLACAGCGKIDYPAEILNQRLSAADCIAAAEECGAPVVAIAGGEPLLHKEMPEIVQALLDRGYSAEDCRKILGGNLLRVFREVEAVSKELQAENRPRIVERQPFDKPAK